MDKVFDKFVGPIGCGLLLFAFVGVIIFPVLFFAQYAIIGNPVDLELISRIGSGIISLFIAGVGLIAISLLVVKTP